MRWNRRADCRQHQPEKVATRHRARRAVGLLLVAVLAAANVAFASAPVAMISDCTGAVRVSASDGQRTCEILRYLEPGATLDVAGGGMVTVVYFASGVEYVFDGAKRVSIGAKAPSVGGSVPTGKTLALSEQTGLAPTSGAGLREAAMVLRSALKPKRIQIIGPRNTTILDARPVFRWKPLEPSVGYRFTLTDETGRTIVEETLQGTELTLPKGVPLAEETYYTWSVEARLGSGANYSSSADFLLADAATRARIARLRPGAGASVSERVVFATFLEREGFYEAADELWIGLAAERPADPALRQKAND